MARGVREVQEVSEFFIIIGNGLLVHASQIAKRLLVMALVTSGVLALWAAFLPTLLVVMSLILRVQLPYCPPFSSYTYGCCGPMPR